MADHKVTKKDDTTIPKKYMHDKKGNMSSDISGYAVIYDIITTVDCLHITVMCVGSRRFLMLSESVWHFVVEVGSQWKKYHPCNDEPRIAQAFVSVALREFVHKKTGEAFQANLGCRMPRHSRITACRSADEKMVW